MTIYSMSPVVLSASSERCAQDWTRAIRTEQDRSHDVDEGAHARRELYHADDPELAADLARAADLMERFNATRATETPLRADLLGELLGSVAADAQIRPPFYCDYGRYISIGAGSFLNFGATLLDVAPITIGRNVQFGPHVQLLTPTHPVEPAPRRAGWEAAKPIVIGDNVWLAVGRSSWPGSPSGRTP